MQANTAITTTTTAVVQKNGKKAFVHCRKKIEVEWLFMQIGRSFDLRY